MLSDAEKNENEPVKDPPAKRRAGARARERMLSDAEKNENKPVKDPTAKRVGHWYFVRRT